MSEHDKRKSEWYKNTPSYLKIRTNPYSEWYLPPEKQKVFYFSSPIDASRNEPLPVLDGKDGFPWCNLSPELFSTVGFTFKTIDRPEVNTILKQGFTELYPYLDTVHLMRFNPFQPMGMYLDERAVGFTYAGIFKKTELAYAGSIEEANKRRAEVGLIHIPPQIRGVGLGSLLFSIATLRLLNESPDTITSHVSDKTGKIDYLNKQLGLTYKGVSKLHPDPEYERNFASDDEREVLKEQLTRKLTVTLEKVKNAKPLIKIRQKVI